MPVQTALDNPIWLALYGQLDPLSAPLIGTYGYHDFTGAAPSIITDHAERSADLLIEQFRRKATNLIASILAFGDQGQLVENSMSDLLVYRNANDAVGVQLDGLGEIVGEARKGRTDEEYRQAILVRVFINSNAGTPEALISACRLLTGATRVRYQEYYPGVAALFTDGLETESGTLASLDAVAPAGVRVVLSQLDYTFIAFVTASEAGIPVDGLGVSEWDTVAGDYYLEGGLPVGGQLVELITM